MSEGERLGVLRWNAFVLIAFGAIAGAILSFVILSAIWFPIIRGDGAEASQTASIHCDDQDAGANSNCSHNGATLGHAKSAEGDSCETEKPDKRSYDECLLTRYTGQLARYTLNLWIATLVLATVGVFGIGLTFYEVRLNRQEFIASHRPRLIVHSVEVAYGVNDEGFPTLGATIHVFNIGDTEAVIDEFVGDIQIRDVPLRAGIILPTIEMQPIVIGVGEGRHLIVPSEFDNQRLNIALRVAPTRILCLATFVYRDGRGTPRQTGLCRQYSTSSGEGRWQEYTAPEVKFYEHSY
jgi:hypothetical protein